MRYNKFLKAVVLIVFVGVCLGSLLYSIDAEAAQEGKGVVKENKAITGEVGFINSELISIIDDTNETPGYSHETLYYLDKDVNVTRKDSIHEIKVGDTIEIDYEKATKTVKGKQKSKKTVKGVKFLREKRKDKLFKSGKK